MKHKTLLDSFPQLVKEWHPTKNIGLTPNNVTCRSNKKVWWMCLECNYEWEAIINNRIRSLKCPSCIGRAVTKDNCLGNKCPELAKEWHPTKNADITPYDVTLRSGKKIWWKCSYCGNEWQSSPNNRTQRGKITKCFQCGSLGIRNPNLSKEWHPTKNGDLTPYDISYGSGKCVWWKCLNCKNEWKASVRDRSNEEKKCPDCNCLLKQNPNLSKEWHPTKNGKLKPKNVSRGSKKTVWWKCEKCGYAWEALIYKRNIGLKSCLRCRSLGIMSPELSEEWHPTKNGKLTPYEVSMGSNLNIWWLCSKCKHSWIARPQSRQDGNGCPNCFKITLRDGTICDSITEAYYYLVLKDRKIDFLYNEKYGDLGVHGNCKYDFYIPEEKKIIEVTSFDKSVKWWVSYLRNIVRKKRYVENVLHENFEFVQIKLSKSQTKYVRQNEDKTK